MRSLEHLAGAMMAQGRAKEGMKYKCWRAFGEDAAFMLPVLMREDGEAGSLEEYGIARDEQGANVRGKKAKRAET